MELLELQVDLTMSVDVIGAIYAASLNRYLYDVDSDSCGAFEKVYLSASADAVDQ
jgi:hypothetical protein